jgi:hypothetical protein
MTRPNLHLVEPKHFDSIEAYRDTGCIPVSEDEPREPISLKKALLVAAVFTVVTYSLLTAALVLL